MSGFRVVGYEPVEATSYFIEYWYDKHQKYWVVQVFDNNMVEQESQVGIFRSDLKSVLEEYKSTYNTSDVRHM